MWLRVTTTTEPMGRDREITRDYIAAERAFTSDRGDARAKVRLDDMRKVIDQLAPALWQHQPKSKSDQVVWAEYMLEGAVVFLIREDNVAMFRKARNRAKAIATERTLNAQARENLCCGSDAQLYSR